MTLPHGLQSETKPHRRILNNQIARQHDSVFRAVPFTESVPPPCHVDERHDRSRLNAQIPVYDWLAANLLVRVIRTTERQGECL